jgi:uncharacterized membrane protein YbaN (DUF454 family)
MARLLRHLAGWALIVLGVVGLVLPVLQGWLFIAMGSLLLAPDVPMFARLVAWVETHFPAVRAVLDRMRRKRDGDGAGPPGESSG